jgi:hypothetical protein
MNKENITTIVIKKEGDKIHFEYQNCHAIKGYALTMAHLTEILGIVDIKTRKILINKTIEILNTIKRTK